MSITEPRPPSTSVGSERSRPREVQADVVYNFAFGSNLSPDKRNSRGANGTAITTKSTCPAYVEGFRLAFNMPMFPPLEPGMAALTSATSDECCHGLLLELGREEYERLWLSEGGSAAKPPYDETVVLAKTYDGREVKAIAFTASSHSAKPYELPPSARYKDIMLKGARDSGLAPAWIDYIQNIPSSNPTKILQLICACYLQFSIFLFRQGGGFARDRKGWIGSLARAMSAGYRAALVSVYRHVAWQGSLRLKPFRVVGPSSEANSEATPSLLLHTMRLMAAEVALSILLLPGALMGILIRAIRTLQGKPMYSFGPPSKK